MTRKTMRGLVAALAALVLGACEGPASTADTGAADTEAVTAAIDSIIQRTMESAARVDAEGVLEASRGVDSVTMLIGDVILTGYEPILASFQDTYSGLREQQHTLLDKQIRVISPDVALAVLTGQGTYTDQAGWQSDPVGLGLTVVFVRRGDRWQAVHAHQSITD
jgi:hypothetical protein